MSASLTRIRRRSCCQLSGHQNRCVHRGRPGPSSRWDRVCRGCSTWRRRETTSPASGRPPHERARVPGGRWRVAAVHGGLKADSRPCVLEEPHGAPGPSTTRGWTAQWPGRPPSREVGAAPPGERVGKAARRASSSCTLRGTTPGREVVVVIPPALDRSALPGPCGSPQLSPTPRGHDDMQVPPSTASGARTPSGRPSARSAPAHRLRSPGPQTCPACAPAGCSMC